MNTQDRRAFLQSAAGVPAVAALSTLPAYARVPGANDRIRVALIGCGGMGRGDLRDFLQSGNVDCAALCDVDLAQIAKCKESVVAPAGQHPELETQDFRRVLDRNDIDAVIVATPDHWHALPTIMACQSGKDVYVEKPLSVSIGEGRLMVDAARKYKRVVQMGTHQRSASHYREAIEYVQSGKLGKIRLVRAWTYLDWLDQLRVRHDGETAGRRRLRYVARTGSQPAVQCQPVSFQLPLVLGFMLAA